MYTLIAVYVHVNGFIDLTSTSHTIPLCLQAIKHWIPLANELPDGCCWRAIESLPPCHYLLLSIYWMRHIFSVTRICLWIEVCYIIHFILLAFMIKNAFTVLWITSKLLILSKAFAFYRHKLQGFCLGPHVLWALKSIGDRITRIENMSYRFVKAESWGW